MTPKILATAAVAAAMVVLAIWWSLSGKPKPNPENPSQPTQGVGSEVATNRTNTSKVFAPRVRSGTNVNVTTPSVVASAANQITNWEETIDVLLRDEGEPGPKAKQLLELLPRFPEEGQVQAAQHIANLLADEDYAPFAAYLTNTNTPVDVQDVIMADLLGRPNSIKLPTLLETARTPQHAKASDAKDLLELYLEKDYGNDWDRWQQALEVWLKENQD